MDQESPAVLIPEEAIRERVSELARRISADYAGAGELLLIGVLRGCYIFLADLSRRLSVPASVDFVAVSSYRRATARGGAVRLLMDVRSDISGRHVLIVEDIVDTGRTLRRLASSLLARNPASLKTCVLVRKSAQASPKIEVDYAGFEIPDVWVVGYGLDLADRFRGLPYIGVVDAGSAGAAPSRGDAPRGGTS